MAVPDKLFSIATILQRGVDLYPELTRRWANLQDYLQQYAANHTHSGGPDGGFINVTASLDTAARTFTNTSFLDLDALTGGSGSINAEAVTVTTNTAALVIIGARISNSDLGESTIVGYRISGATTQTASAVRSLLYESGAANDAIQASWVQVATGLTAGSNTFEMQAEVTGGTGSIDQPLICVLPVS